METLQVTWGRKLEIRAEDWCDANGVKKTELLDAVAARALVTRNAVTPIFRRYDAAPGTEKRGDLDARYRAAILAIVIGQLADFGLSTDDLKRTDRVGDIRLEVLSTLGKHSSGACMSSAAIAA